MRRDDLYLSDIVEAAESIAAFLSGRGRDSFLQDDLLRSAVLHKLTVIGEAAARVSEDLRVRHPEVEWPDIVGFRNIAVHAYFVVDWSIVWETATQDAPQLRGQVLEILKSEFGGQ
ncbi:MAG: DUF86 domain-containing protein [Acidobacteria bacterium]|nr:DUF86 domain-containing protein [Acidobacteriota bacterium]